MGGSVFICDNNRNMFSVMDSQVFKHFKTLSFDLRACFIFQKFDKQLRCSVFTFVQYTCKSSVEPPEIVHLEQKGLIPESQCGFRKDRGTIYMIFTARQLQEKCQEQNVDLNMTFVDLTKAFDTVRLDGLGKIMAKFGYPPRFISMVRRFHDGMQARVQNDGEFSEPFEVTNWVKQGCVMAPTLFSKMFSAMLMDAFQDSDTAFPIRYRFDGNIFNLASQN